MMFFVKFLPTLREKMAFFHKAELVLPFSSYVIDICLNFAIMEVHNKRKGFSRHEKSIVVRSHFLAAAFPDRL